MFRKNVITLNESVAVGRTDGRHTEIHFYHSVFVFLLKKEKHSVNGDGDMGKIKSKSRFTDYVTPLGDPIFHL